jgi:hypothetical protein
MTEQKEQPKKHETTAAPNLPPVVPTTPVETSPATTPIQHPENNTDNRRKTFRKHRNSIATIFAAIAAVSSAVAAICAVVTARTTISQYKNDQRAWIGTVKCNYGGYGETQGSIPNIRVAVEFINFGKTPALKVQSQVSACVLKADEKFSPDYKTIRPKIWPPLMPQMPLVISLESNDVPITNNDFYYFNGGQKIFYFYGKVTYEDISGRPHTTTFRYYVINPNGSIGDPRNFNPLVQDTMTAASTYNDAD